MTASVRQTEVARDRGMRRDIKTVGLPWLAGLCLISLLGHYHNGLGLLGFGWGELVVAVFSLAIYVLAVRTRLPVADCVAHAQRGEPAETCPPSAAPMGRDT